MTSDTHRTHSPNSEQRQIEGIIPGVVHELTSRHHLLCGKQVALGILVGHDLRILGKTKKGGRRDGHP